MNGYLEGLTALRDAAALSTRAAAALEPGLLPRVDMVIDDRGLVLSYRGRERVVPMNKAFSVQGNKAFSFSQEWADGEAARFAREVDFPERQAARRRRFRTEQRNILARRRRRR